MYVMHNIVVSVPIVEGLAVAFHHDFRTPSHPLHSGGISASTTTIPRGDYDIQSNDTREKHPNSFYPHWGSF